MVLVVALALVFGIARLLGGENDPDAQQTGAGVDPSTVATSPAPSPSPSAPSSSPKAGSFAPSTPTATASTTRSVTGGKAKQGKPEPLADPSGPCTRSDIVATAEIDGAVYAGGVVRFSIELTTLTTPACTWTVSPTSLVVKLTSGDDRIWTSQECPAAIETEQVVVREKVAAVVDVTWGGQRSDATCSNTTLWAEPGWYHIEAAAFGAEPTDVQFELEQPEPIAVKPDREKKKKQAAQDRRDESKKSRPAEQRSPRR